MEEEGPEKCPCGKEATMRSNYLGKSFCSLECEEDGWREASNGEKKGCFRWKLKIKSKR